ncbi:MAG: hypothetical protein Q8K02_17270, partial [Flavobacterium sp.]|nr:hypothetical protein [Flavobacterium sp.]
MKQKKANTIPQIKKQETDKKATSSSLLLLLLAVVITAITFSNSINNDFASNWDDNVYVLNSELTKDLSFRAIKEIFTTFYGGNYHPITTLSFAIEYELFGLTAKPYHVLNFLLHLLNVVLVFYFFKLFSKNINIAFLVAVFFGVHPMHVESVSWITERKDLLFMAFYMGSLIFYLKYILGKPQIRNLIFSFLLFTGACFSKSMAVSLPLVLFLLDYYLKRGFSIKNIAEKIPFLAISVLFGILAILSQKASGTIYSHLPFTWFERVFLISYSLSFYIVKLFAPLNLCVTHFYPKSGETLDLIYWLSPLLLLLVSFLVFKTKKFKKELVFGILFYFFT